MPGHMTSHQANVTPMFWDTLKLKSLQHFLLPVWVNYENHNHVWYCYSHHLRNFTQKQQGPRTCVSCTCTL